MALSQRVNELIPRRAVLGALMFFACMFSYVIRTNLSIIIVAMVAGKKGGATRGPECNADGFVNYTAVANQSLMTTALPDYGPRYPWSQNVVGLILAAYFYGTLPSSVPGGMLAEKFGGARVVAFATLIPAVLNLLMPYAADAHYMLLVILRFIMGFFGVSLYKRFFLGFDMKNAGVLTGLPYITRLLAGVLFALAGDFCRRKSVMTTGWIRRIFMIFSHVLPAICLILISYAGCNRFTAIAMMTLALTFNGAACQTSLQNHQDLAPNFAGSLYGIMNTFGSFSGFIIPAILGVLINEHNGMLEWRVMFWISSIVFASATLLFWIFGSAEVQPWNDLSIGLKTANIEVAEEQKRINSKEAEANEEEENEKL
ncbi:vesicular glutamate transporter 1 [Copidosoma floridanum]|uniref:vesicular glutamate transporter 1 n=1 Tax=Copidosoma floridanum TaxID=29053 RepID=UPI000C6F65A5|nr:vesicular glutamate transporter 1 [Copidosoma floridanum]